MVKTAVAIILFCIVCSPTTQAEPPTIESPKLPFSAVRVDVATLPAACQMELQQIEKGLTRVELQRDFYVDGGLSSPFREERFVLKDCQRKEVIKILVQFRPAGMSKILFLSGKWGFPKQSSEDTLWSFSPPYWETGFSD